MQDIDLGSKPKYNVKVGGQSYMIDCPTAIEAEKLSEEIKKKEKSEVSLFLNFVVKLGLPKDIAAGLSANQIIKLGKGISGEENGKKK